MAETAGLVLGGLPLLLYAIDNYKRCLDPAKDFFRYDVTLSTIRNHLVIQQEQLDVTFRNLGLDNLSECSRRKLYYFLSKKYCDARVSCFLDIIDKMEFTIKKTMEKLDLDASGKPRWTHSQERVGWEWRRVKRSFNRKERQALVSELQYWNNALKNIFEKTEIPAGDSNPTVDQIKRRYNSTHCDSIRQNIRTMHELLSNQWGCDCLEHLGNLQLDWHVQDSEVSVDQFCLIMPSNCCHRWHQFSMKFQDEDSETTPLATREQSSVSSCDSANPTRPLSTYRLGSYQVSLSKNSNTPNRSSVPLVEARRPQIEAHPSNGISCLCTYFNPVNACCQRSGYISCPTELRKRLFVDLQASSSMPAPLVSLKDLLQPTGGSQIQASFSRRQRFAIAAAATWATLYLCGTPWMEDDWKQIEYIQVVLNNDNQETASSTAVPTLRHKLKSPPPSKSLQKQPINATEAIQRNQIRNKELFSLGILLIELCLGKTFDTIRQEADQDSLSFAMGFEAPTDQYFAIIDSQIDKVYNDAGDLYGYAVQRCLRCEFPGRDATKSFDFQQFRHHFFAGVIAPVQATFMMMPESIAAL